MVATLAENLKPLEDKLLALARELLGGKDAVRSVLMSVDDDEAGRPTLFATLILTRNEEPQDAKSLLRFMLTAHERLEESGDSRFPVFSFVSAADYDQHAAA